MTEVFQRFSTYRSHGTRSSPEIVAHGEPLLLNGGYRSADDPWAFLEQLAFAALDTGRLDIADDCLVLLDTQFPDSPRVTVLKGQRLEADGMLQDAIKMYVYYLTKEDENCVPVRKRLITALRSHGRITEATEELVKYLDIYYADVEGWLELADIYAACNLYDNSLSALAHAQLIAPQTPQIALCSAETAYTSGDVALALKTFLRAAELCGSGPNTPPGGTQTRAWLGVKLCLSKLSHSADAGVNHPKLLEELATERILAAYSKANDSAKPGEATRGVVLKWLGASQTAK